MKKIKIHPFFIALCIIMIAIGRTKLFCATLIAVLFHEFCHYIVARKRGFVASVCTIMPYGATLSIDGGLNDSDLFAVAIAGPLGNLLLSLVILSSWWLFPSSYPYTNELFRANVTIALFNLLPFYPLDGSRILSSFMRNKTKCLRLTSIFSYVGSAVFAIAYIISGFFTISHSLAIASVMLYIGAAFSSEKEKYALILRENYLLKDLSRPIERKELYVSKNIKIGALTAKLNPKYIYTVHVVDGNFKPIKTLTEQELEKLFFVEKSRPLAAVIDIDKIN